MDQEKRKIQIQQLRTLCKDNDVIFDEYWPSENPENLSDKDFAFSQNLIELACYYKERSKEEWNTLKMQIASLEKVNTPTDKGVLLLYQSVLPLEKDVEADIDKKIKEAGEMIYKQKGMKGLRDESMLQFIPSIAKPVVNVAWDGIGDWRA